MNHSLSIRFLFRVVKRRVPLFSNDDPFLVWKRTFTVACLSMADTPGRLCGETSVCLLLRAQVQSLVDGVERQFQAVGNPELVEDVV